MGYFVSSLAAIGPDDTHGLWLTYLPARHRIKYEWINDWIYEKFVMLAKNLGPEAVIVAPSQGGIYEEFQDGDFSDLSTISVSGDAVHSGFPFLVLSKSPLMQQVSVDGNVDAVCINLAAFSTNDELAGLFDELASAARRLPADLRQLRVTVPGTNLRPEYDTYMGGWSFAFEEALELKPNFFGLGINLNAIARGWRSRRARIRAEREAKSIER